MFNFFILILSFKRICDQ